MCLLLLALIIVFSFFPSCILSFYSMVSSEDCFDNNFDCFLSHLSLVYLTYSVLMALMYPVLLLLIVMVSFSDCSDDDFD